MRKHKSVNILPAERKGLTVTLNVTNYSEMAQQILNGTTTYRLLDTEPPAKLEKNVNKSLKKLQEMKWVNKEECSSKKLRLPTLRNSTNKPEFPYRNENNPRMMEEKTVVYKFVGMRCDKCYVGVTTIIQMIYV